MDYQSFQPGGQSQNNFSVSSPPNQSGSSKIFTPKFIGVIVGLLVLGVGAYASIWYWQKQIISQEVVPVFTPRVSTQVYRNELFGFSIALPESWKGYTINQIKEDLYDVTGKTKTNNGVVDSFQLVEIHHPLETANNPREDMPIMIFTPSQWDHVQKEEWSAGAAPIPPSILGQNSKYILALPARYNYDFKTGWEEVDQLVKTLKAFEPK